MSECSICRVAFDSPYPKKTCSPACASISRKDAVMAKPSPGAAKTVAVDHSGFGAAPDRTAGDVVRSVERGTFAAKGFSMLRGRI